MIGDHTERVVGIRFGARTRSNGPAGAVGYDGCTSMTPTTKRVADLVFDVGLHKGEDSSFYLAKGYRVVAFEAHPALATRCRQRFAPEIADGRMTIIEGAISDCHEATVPFYTHPNTVWGTINARWAQRNLVVAESALVDVPTVDLAATLQTTGMPYFMKIDVEGADRHCLETLRSFDQRPTFVSIESEQEDWDKLEAEFTLLEQLGYDRFSVVQQARFPGTRIRTTTIDGRPLVYEFEPDASGPFGVDVSPWLTKTEALARYRRVFRGYQLLGPSSWIRRTKLGRGLRGQAAKYSRLPLPGWFDTHATSSAAIGP
jgi:FkbM family methyltransferase